MVVERYSYGLYGDPDTQAFVDTARTNLLVSQDAIDEHAQVFGACIDYIGTDGLRGDLRADVDGDGIISSWDQLRFAQQQTAWTLINIDQIAANSDEAIDDWSTVGQLSRPHPVGMKPTGEPLDAGTPSQPFHREQYKLRGVVQLDNRLGYAGYVWDPFLQMYHVRHRVLNARLGIWMQPDPIGYAGGWNLHEYCGGDPLGFVDPMGLDPWWSVAYNRFVGAVRFVGGGLETAAGVAIGVATGWTGVGLLGGVLVTAHGLDNAQAGLRQLITGEPVQGGTEYLLEGGAKYLGMDPQAAKVTASLADAAISLLGGGGLRMLTQLADNIGLTLLRALRSIGPGRQLAGFRGIAIAASDLVVAIAIVEGITTAQLGIGVAFVVRATAAAILGENGMSVRGASGVGASRPPHHHVFPQEEVKWFKDRGITIDEHTIPMSEAEHEAIHVRGWNKVIMERLRELEAAYGRQLVPDEIIYVGKKVCDEFKIPNSDWIPYGK
jgi:RHS repeat-associated protein